MENAGRGVADKLCQLGTGGPIVVCCGPGNNGGDGFVIARHLDLRRVAVKVLAWGDPGQGTGEAAINYRILERSGVPIVNMSAGSLSNASDMTAEIARQLAGAAWVVDALLGTGAKGEPRAPLAVAIDAINTAGVPILAVDLPSGLDCDTGQPAQHTIRAATPVRSSRKSRASWSLAPRRLPARYRWSTSAPCASWLKTCWPGGEGHPGQGQDRRSPRIVELHAIVRLPRRRRQKARLILLARA